MENMFQTTNQIFIHLVLASESITPNKHVQTCTSSVQYCQDQDGILSIDDLYVTNTNVEWSG